MLEMKLTCTCCCFPTTLKEMAIKHCIITIFSLNTYTVRNSVNKKLTDLDCSGCMGKYQTSEIKTSEKSNLGNLEIKTVQLTLQCASYSLA